MCPSETDKRCLAANLSNGGLYRLVNKADRAWKFGHKGGKCGVTHLDATPSQWAHTNLSLGLTVASTVHIW